MIIAITFGALALLCVPALWVLGRAADVGPFTCVGRDFDSSGWNGSRGRRLEEARLIERCDYFAGATRETVGNALGAPSQVGSERKWSFYLGEVNTAYGPGDAGKLVIEFDGSGRVQSVDAPTAYGFD